MAKNKYNNSLARTMLMPLIKHCAENHGAKEQVARRLEKVLGRKVANHQVKSWLHPDAKTWRSPLFSTGMALLAVQAEITGEVKIINAKLP